MGAFSIEESSTEPDGFLREALEAKILHLKSRIEMLRAEVTVRFEAGAEADILEDALGEFINRLESLKDRESVSDVEIPAPPPQPSAPPSQSFLPFGAIPKPRKYSRGGTDSRPREPLTVKLPPLSRPAASSPAPTTAIPSPAPAVAAPVPAKSGGMLSFLQSVKTGEPAGRTAAPPPEKEIPVSAEAILPAPPPADTPHPPPVTKAPSTGGIGALLRKVQSGTAEGPSVPEPPAAVTSSAPAMELEPSAASAAASAAAPADSSSSSAAPAKSGSMLSALRKIQSGAPADKALAEKKAAEPQPAKQARKDASEEKGPGKELNSELSGLLDEIG